MGLVPGTADRHALGFNIEAEVSRQCVKHLFSLGDNFRADAVAR